MLVLDGYLIELTVEDPGAKPDSFDFAWLSRWILLDGYLMGT
jgi:hypothetical protein